MRIALIIVSVAHPTNLDPKATDMSHAPSTSWHDPLRLSDLLNDEEQLIRQTAHDYAREKLLPRIISANRDSVFDREILREMGALGLLGAMSASEYGGSDASHIAYGLIAREIEAIDSAYRSAMSVQSSLVMFPIEKFGSAAQKKKYLPGLASGELVGCFGLTEADGGSDPGAMRTTAVETPDGYKLSGTKMWITNAPIADIAVVWAKLDGEIRGFIVERETQGFLAPEIKGKLSLRASITGEIVLENATVSKDSILPNVKGLRGPFSCLNKARYGISWGALGAAEFCWHAARDYALTRKVFDKPIAATQLVQQKLANMQTDISLGLLGAWRLGKCLDEGKAPIEAISQMKRNNCQKALETARNARDILGGNGISEDYHVMRHAMNLETVNTYEGTHDIHTLIMGRAITGHQAFF